MHGSILNERSNILWLEPTRRYSFDFTADVNTFRPQGHFSSPTILVKSVGTVHGRLLERQPLVRPRLCKPTCPPVPSPLSRYPSPLSWTVGESHLRESVVRLFLPLHFCGKGWCGVTVTCSCHWGPWTTWKCVMCFVVHFWILCSNSPYFACCVHNPSLFQRLQQPEHFKLMKNKTTFAALLVVVTVGLGLGLGTQRWYLFERYKVWLSLLDSTVISVVAIF